MQGGERSPQHPTHLPFLTEMAARGSPGQVVRMLLGGLEEGVLLSPGERWWPCTSAWWGNPGQVREDAHGRVSTFGASFSPITSGHRPLNLVRLGVHFPSS